MERTTGRPPDSSRLKLARSFIGERRAATAMGSDTSAWPLSSSVDSGASWRFLALSSSKSPKMKPGQALGWAKRSRSVATLASRRLPAAGAP